VPNCESFLVTETERKHVWRRARFQQHRDANCRQVFFLARQEAILPERLGEYAPSYNTVKNWMAQFKRGDFCNCDVPRPGRTKTVTTLEIVDQNSRANLGRLTDLG